VGDWGTFPDIVGISLEILFLVRDAMHSAECAIMRCPSVCLLGLGIASKQLNILADLLTVWKSHCSGFIVPNVIAVFRWEPPMGCRLQIVS